jgi:hypothetical protein
MAFRTVAALGSAALVLVGLAAACTRDLDIGPPWMDSVGSVPCAEEVRETLEGWGAGADMLPGPPAEGAGVRFRFPTHDLGAWLVLEAGESSATVSRVTPDSVTTQAFASDCTPATTWQTNPLPDRGPERFTDADLRRTVSSARGGGARGVVVYLWSPHMPLSVDGYREIQAAAKDHGLGLVALLFPGSNLDFAAAAAERAGIPADALREAASVELTFRDALVHAPTILVFDGDRVSAVLPGYRSAEGYRGFLSQFIGPS